MNATVKKVLQDNFNCDIVVKLSKISHRSDMEKLLFVEIVNLLREAEDRSAMLEAFGLDLQEYDNLYYSVMQNLFKLHFSEGQIELINYFIYQLPLQEDFQGKLEMKKGRKVVVHNFETAEDLWEVIKELR